MVSFNSSAVADISMFIHSFCNVGITPSDGLTRCGPHPASLVTPLDKIFIHSGYFYSVSSSPLLLIGATNTALILCHSFTPKRRRQLRVKVLKVPGWRLERDSNKFKLPIKDERNFIPRLLYNDI